MERRGLGSVRDSEAGLAGDVLRASQPIPLSGSNVRTKTPPDKTEVDIVSVGEGDEPFTGIGFVSAAIYAKPPE